MDHTAATARTLDLHRLELRYAELRVPDALAITRLARSIAVNGQLVPCIAVAGEGNALILLDGYRRVAALRQLGKDTAEVECWDGAGVLARLGVVAGPVADPTPVACDHQHDVERFLRIDFPAAPSAPYPGQVELAQFAEPQCRQTFGDIFDGGPGRATALIPSPAQWSTDERTISCVRFLPDGGSLVRKSSATTTTR